jgi:cation diffusion facilitator family transporter
VLLSVAAYEILSGAINRLFTHQVPQVSPLSFMVMAITIAINLGTSLYEAYRGRQLKSELLLADAVHTRSDVWVSLSVIAGLIGVKLGWGWLDAGIGVVIAGIIGWSAWRILHQAAQVLMDRAILPEGDIEQVALALPGVESVERIRSRGRLDETYLDLHVRVKPQTPIDQAHSIAHAVQHQLKQTFPQTADVTIHIEPEPTSQPDEADMVRQLEAIAYSLGAAIHDVWVYLREGQCFVELHLEVSTALTLDEAHALATEFEERGKAALTTIAGITTHIEPMGEAITIAPTLSAATASHLTHQAQRIAAEVCGPTACHDFHLWPNQAAPALSLHCTLPSGLPIIEAHQVSEQLKNQLRQRLPQLKRVMVHVEPPSL